MSIDLVAAALWLPLEPNRKLVLIALCERANMTTGLCWPGRDEIAARTSLSERRVTPHLQALEADGWTTSRRRGSPRHGQTTYRWVNVRKVLSEGEAARDSFLAGRLQDDSSPNDGWDPDQGTFEALLGDVASSLGDDRDTIRGRCDADRTVKEPSDQPSIEPSGSRDPIATTSREGAVIAENVGDDAASDPPARPRGDEMAFGRLLRRGLSASVVAELNENTEYELAHNVIVFTRAPALSPGAVAVVRRAAINAGFDGILFADAVK